MDKLGNALDTLATYVVGNVATKQELQDFKNETNARFDEIDNKFSEIDNRFNEVSNQLSEVDDRFDEERSYNKSMHNALVDVLEKQAIIPNESAIRIRRF